MNRKKSITMMLVSLIIFISGFLLTGAIYSEAASPTPPKGDSGWKLVFDDEFDGTSLDTTKWSYNYPWGNTHNHRAYCAPENVSVANGLLRIKAENKRHPKAPQTVKSDGKTLSLDYTSGAVNTKGKFGITTGYIEGRFKMPGTTGFWPAFWTLNTTGEWPPEIDILEILCHAPNELHTNYHYGPSWDNKWSFYTKKTVADLSKDFHTFAVEWAPGYMKWFLDGVQVGNTFTNSEWIAQAQNMYLIINLAIGGWESNPDSTTVWPSYYECDWVRVWQKTGDGTFGNPGFESGSLSPWTTWNDAAASANNARTGIYSLGLGNGPASAEQVVSVLPDTTYTFSGYGKVPEGQEALIGVKGYGGPQLTSSIRSTSYSKGRVTFTTGSSNTQATVFFYHASGTGYCYGDDFELTAVSSITPSVTRTPTVTPASTRTPTPTPTPTKDSSYIISGYIDADFSYSASAAPVVKSGFVIELAGKYYNAVTDSTGYFELGIPAQALECDFRISKQGFLSRTISNVNITGDMKLSIAGEPIKIWAGDMVVKGVQDNAINMADIIEIARSFNTYKGNPAFNSAVDINKDNSVNMKDIVIIAAHFNSASSSYPEIAFRSI